MGEYTALRLILASASPARRELLTRDNYQFEVIPANIVEPTDASFDEPRSYVQHVAWLKAAAVAPRISDEPALVLSADTVGWLHGRAIGKPADEEDARRILRRLSGTEHELWTGVCLWRRPDNVQLAWQEVSRVFMQRLTDDEMDRYLATRVWQGCSGAYAIQEEGDPYVHVVHGSISNVIGLPLESLRRALTLLK
jgi:septum formation protein